MNSSIDASLPWLDVHALAAEDGDCIVLSYGVGKVHFRLVVDAGVAGTSDRLRHVLDESGDAVWELLVVTHIDRDHIGGTLSLLSDKPIATRFKDIWFNGRQHLEGKRESMGVADGNQLAELLAHEGISWNEAFSKGAVCLGTDDAPVIKTLPASQATITILSPSAEKLAALRVCWDSWILKAEKPIETESAQAEQVAPGIEVLSIAPLSIADLADSKTKMDRSVPNGSSIAFIFEYCGFRVLLGADAHANVLFKSVEKLSAEPLDLDVFKLPHHGSSANVTKNLMLKLPARQYLLTTDGERHTTHPSDVAIARALIVTPDAELLFNYPNQAYERWAGRASEGDNRFKVRAGKEGEGIRIELRRVPGQGA